MSDLSLVKPDTTPARTQDSQEPMPNCPFYGFYLQPAMRIMIYQHGNQCALISGSYSPCKMDHTGRKTDWHKCPYNTPKNNATLVILADTIHVFPRDNALDSTPKEGLTLAEWMRRFS